MFSVFPYIARNMVTCVRDRPMCLFSGLLLTGATFRIQTEYTGISILVLPLGLPFVGAQFHILCI